jgi:sugar O-acyltransferase (sialic acid O-acetyltransferase NeuD family)
MPTEIYITGAGGLGCEIAASLFHPELQKEFTLRGFIDDKYAPAEVINGVPVQGDLAWLKSVTGGNAIIAVADPSVRRKIRETLNGCNLQFPAVIHPEASIHSTTFVSVGQGSYIAGGCILTTRISIGQHSMLLPGVSLSHDTEIGDFCTLMPGVRISSGAVIGNRVTIGTGAIIAKNVTIEEGAVIAAGAVIS